MSMNALGFHKHGDHSVMEILTLPIPKPKPDEILIRVKASAFNRLDLWVRQGWPGLKLALPHISGSDCAGEVVECGTSVTNFAVNDKVAVNPGLNQYEDEYTAVGDQSVSPGFKIFGEQLPGTHAQYICAPSKNCIKIPKHVDFETAAACGLVGVTTWRMLMKQAQMRFNQKILVVGAGGGVNSFAIQLAALAGCEVFTITSSEKKQAQALALGARHCLNYQEDAHWPQKLLQLTNSKGFDIVVDNVGCATLAISMKLVKRGGKIVIVGNTTGPKAHIDIRYIFSKQISLIGSTMGNHDDYCQAMNCIFEKKIKPVIHKCYPLTQGVNAMEAFETNRHFGKILLVHP